TPQIRNTATIGGNICRAAPSADMAPPLLVLDAEMKFVSASGERWVAMDAFFLDLNQTALEENELLAEIKVPIPPVETASCFLKIGRTVIDIAIVNMAARMTMDDRGILTDVRIAFGAVAPTPLRIKAAEEILLGTDVSTIDDTLVGKVSNKVGDEIKPITDVRGTAEYRREISRVLTKRAIENIIQTLQGRLNS
ncbi:MAG: FAD binding domain-containing protein, partial [Desulfotignum sp.]|nr:FAD binding domain-containing protein [Desulfotignum sp.]